MLCFGIYEYPICVCEHNSSEINNDFNHTTTTQMHTVCVFLCFVEVSYRPIVQLPPGLFHWCWGDHTIDQYDVNIDNEAIGKVGSKWRK